MDGIDQLLHWAWARHHNPWSWYIRPLFILPFCYFACRRNVRGVLLTILAAITSIAWFPAPEAPSPEVLKYLEVEKRWLSSVPLSTAIAVLVGGSLWLIAAAFWTRRWLYGVLVLNIATVAKVVFSVFFGGDAGWASVVPAFATLGICNAVFAGFYVWSRSSSEPLH
jgi:hypothetical protein